MVIQHPNVCKITRTLLLIVVCVDREVVGNFESLTWWSFWLFFPGLVIKGEHVVRSVTVRQRIFLTNLWWIQAVIRL